MGSLATHSRLYPEMELLGIDVQGMKRLLPLQGLPVSALTTALLRPTSPIPTHCPYRSNVSAPALVMVTGVGVGVGVGAGVEPAPSTIGRNWCGVRVGSTMRTSSRIV